jgi:hypothetical protein
MLSARLVSFGRSPKWATLATNTQTSLFFVQDGCEGETNTTVWVGLVLSSLLSPRVSLGGCCDRNDRL